MMWMNEHHSSRVNFVYCQQRGKKKTSVINQSDQASNKFNKYQIEDQHYR